MALRVAAPPVEVYARGTCNGGKNKSPKASIALSTDKGTAPLNVTLDASGSEDKDGKIIRYDWTWNGGQGTGVKPELLLPKGKYDITLTVTDDGGATATDKVKIDVQAAEPVRNTEYWLEAECAIVGSAWKVVKDSRASGGVYLSPTGKSGSVAPQDVPANRVRFVVDNAEAGKFGVFALIETRDGSSDSYWIRVNNGGWYNWQQGFATGARGFNWIEKAGDPLQFRSGTNTVDFAFREPDTRLDKVHFDKQYDAPFGQGESAGNCGTTPPPTEPDAPPKPDNNTAPTARITTSTLSGPAPLRVDFDARSSSDSDGQIVAYRWAWKGGQSDEIRKGFVFDVGTYEVTLTVTDNDGATGTQRVRVTATEPAGPPPTEPDEDKGTNNYWLEAECAQVGNTWSVERSAEAANGGYVVVRGRNADNSPPSSVAANLVKFTVQDVESGEYRLYARISAESKLSDSYWVRINGGSWYRWYSGIISNGRFNWNRYPTGPLRLRAGTNTIEFTFREAGARLDKLFLTDGNREPSGTGGQAESCEVSVQPSIAIEAECATVGSGWRRYTHDNASNDSYLAFTGDRNERVPTSNVASQQVVFRVETTERATYHLFLRMNAPTNGKNSVWVRIDEGAWIRFWQEIGGQQLMTKGFEWRKVNDDGKDVSFQLSAGTHTIRIANRESFTEIDKLQLSKSSSLPRGFGDEAAACGSQLRQGQAPGVASNTLAGEALTVYPNPAIDRLNLNLVSEYRGEVSLTVTDVTGRQLVQQRTDKPQRELQSDLDVSRLPAGMYYLRVIEGEQQSIKPFVKR